jgi:hypothetical protein
MRCFRGFGYLRAENNLVSVEFIVLCLSSIKGALRIAKLVLSQLSYAPTWVETLGNLDTYNTAAHLSTFTERRLWKLYGNYFEEPPLTAFHFPRTNGNLWKLFRQRAGFRC